MSRAFVKEDEDDQPRRYYLPPRTDPSYPAAAAWALLEGANHGDSMGAEAATGHRWGDPILRPQGSSSAPTPNGVVTSGLFSWRSAF